MSDEDQQQQRAQPEDGEPTPERQAELRAAYEANVAAGELPYKGVRIRNRGELSWVMKEQRWSGKLELPEGYELANLSGALLDSANLSGVDLYSANLSRAVLAEADLSNAYLINANLSRAHLVRANLSDADLDDASLSDADLVRANLSRARLASANLSRAYLDHANLSRAYLDSANLSGAYLDHANLSGADLSKANLSDADLDDASLSDADLSEANLSGANLVRANLSGANLASANLSGANLHLAHMDVNTGLMSTLIDTHTRLADVVWNGVPLTRLNWQDVALLGDEQVARQTRYGGGKRKDTATTRLQEYVDAVLADPVLANWRGVTLLGNEQVARQGKDTAGKRKDTAGKRKDKATRLREYADAVLASRQVAAVLRSQGVNEHADRFAYRAQLCQRRLLRTQRHYLRYFGSLCLGLISGYGYRPLRSFATYLVVVIAFGLAYWALGVHTGHPLSWNEAGVVSLTAFHGRGFFATAFQPGDPQAAIAAIEAVLGLLIEITFIATFTNRFFAR